LARFYWDKTATLPLSYFGKLEFRDPAFLNQILSEFARKCWDKTATHRACQAGELG